MDKRRGQSRPIKSGYLILCGGETEVRYFEGIKKLISDIDASFGERVEFHIQKAGAFPNDMIDCVKGRIAKINAQNPRKPVTNVFYVFDKDSSANNTFDSDIVRIKKLTAKGVFHHPIWSNECFEIFMLLHFYDYKSLPPMNSREDYFSKLGNLLNKRYDKSKPDMVKFFSLTLDKDPAIIKKAINAAQSKINNCANLIPSQCLHSTNIGKFFDVCNLHFDFYKKFLDK